MYLDDTLLRILAFAGLLHLHDVLCKKTYKLAFGKRLLFNTAFTYSIDDKIPRTQNALHHIFGWRHSYTQTLYDIITTVEYMIDQISIGYYNQKAYNLRLKQIEKWQQGIGKYKYKLHSIKNIRIHSSKLLSDYIELPYHLSVLKSELLYLDDTFTHSHWWIKKSHTSFIKQNYHIAVKATRAEWKKKVIRHRSLLFPSMNTDRITIKHSRHFIYRIPPGHLKRHSSKTLRALIY